MGADKILAEANWISPSSNVFVLNSKYKNIDDLYNYYGGGNFKLDLGCGYVKPPGFIGIDNLSGEGSQIPNDKNSPDIYLDLDGACFPFADNSCEEVRSSHFWNIQI